jgi:hypothetical protein
MVMAAINTLARYGPNTGIEDLAPLVAKLQKSKRFTWEHRMLADEQAVVFG